MLLNEVPPCSDLREYLRLTIPTAIHGISLGRLRIRYTTAQPTSEDHHEL